MDSNSRERIETRIHEIDNYLIQRGPCEMTEGWLSCEPETAELEALYMEREDLFEQLHTAA